MLVGEASVHRQEGVMTCRGQLEELSILGARPSAASDRLGFVAYEQRRKIMRQVLIK